MPERSDAPLADEPQPGAVPNDMPAAPSGLPEGADEADPMGAPESDPEGEGDTPRGDDAQPGIPTEGEPPAAS